MTSAIAHRALFLPPLYQDGIDHGRLILRDGSSASLRAATMEDQAALEAFFARLSPDSLRKRFFTAGRPGERALTPMCDSSDPALRMTMVVTRVVEGTPRIVAVGSYFKAAEHGAEVALAVDDTMQGKGIGALLLERLCILAVMHGFHYFLAVAEATNRPMLEIFRHTGFPVEEHSEGGYTEVAFSLRPGEDSVSSSEMRDRVFTAASLRPLFRPRSVAVLGASRDPSSIGHRIVSALLGAGFTGPIYPINPHAGSIGPLQAYASMAEVPSQVDLAVVAVPRDAVLGVVDACAARGVRGLVVITAGFAEVGAEGRRAQERLVQKVRDQGMRLIGPNCLGIINTDAQVRLSASFSPVYPPPGRVAMSSQSGALGLAVLALARRLHVGLSTFASIGNKADVTGNDLLQYWEVDPDTDVILLYLESFGNPRRFARIARRVSRSKPIVAVKGGRTTAGRRAAGSHTAALAGSDVAVDALFHQTGVIRAQTLEEMFDLAAALASQPLPAGDRVAIVTNAGGPGILCADTCEAGGLTVGELSAQTRARLTEYLPAAASVANPVDMIASASAAHYRDTVEAVLIDPSVHAAVVIYIPLGPADVPGILAGVREGVMRARQGGAAGKPVLACIMGQEGVAPPLSANGESIPCYAFPESAARVLARAAQYARWRRQPPGCVPDFDDLHVHAAREICTRALAGRGGGWLTCEESRDVLAALGLPVAPGGVAHTADQAAELARKAGFPVAVKLASHKIVHKTEIGAVHLGVTDTTGVREAFGAIEAAARREGGEGAFDGVLVQPMLSGGVEVMVGVTEDPLFGPLIAFGLGGIHVEVLGDVCFRITPLTDEDARAMVRHIKGRKLLEGYRGHPPADIPAIEDVLLRVSRLVEELPQITQIDLNPVFAMRPGQGCWIVDARIHVDVPASARPERYALTEGDR